MVIDTSAMAAIFFHEPERERLLAALALDQRRLMSAATLLELQMVFSRSSSEAGWAIVAAVLDQFKIEVVAFTREQALAAGEAFRRYGKGRHQARLNFGDCFAYALAKTTDEQLLFKGNDFTETDLRLAPY